MASSVIENGVFVASSNLPLMADVQYLEPYGSSALNRKMAGIIHPGIFQGFDVVPGTTGVSVKITSTGVNQGAASVNVAGGYQVTIQQYQDVEVTVPAGKTSIVALEGNYGQGKITRQVSQAASLDAARFVVVDLAQGLAANQIEICRVNVPTSARAVTAQMIDLTKRVRRRVGPIISDRIDSNEQWDVASSNAVRLALEAAKAEAAKKIAKGDQGLAASSIALNQNFDFQTYVFKGGEYVYIDWNAAKNKPGIDYPSGSYQIFVIGLSDGVSQTLLIRPINYAQPLAPFLISWTGNPGQRVLRWRALVTSFSDINSLSGVTPNSLTLASNVGEFSQPATASAIMANGYPIAEAGLLKVKEGPYKVMQEYTSYSSGRQFSRGRNAGATSGTYVWGQWVEQARISDLQNYFGSVNIATSDVPQINNFDWQQFDIKAGGLIRAVTSNWVHVPAGLSYAGTWNVAIQCVSATGTNYSLRVITMTTDKTQFKEYNVTMTGAKGSRAFTVQRTLNDMDVTSSQTDNRTGQLLKVGDFGLGSGGIAITEATINAGTPKKLLEWLKGKGSGFYRLNRPAPNGFRQDTPFIFTLSGDTMFALSVDYGNGVVTTVATNNSGLAADRVAVNTLYGTANKPTNVDLNLVSRAGDTMTGELQIQRNGTGIRFYKDNSATDYGLVMQRSESNFYMIPTLIGQAKTGAIHATMRPFTMDLTNGYVYLGNGLSVISSGLAVGSASGLKSGLGANSIAIGDNDTGLRWNSDGNFDIMTNSAAAMNISTTAITLTKTLATGATAGSWTDWRDKAGMIQNGQTIGDGSFMGMLKMNHSDRKFVLGGIGKQNMGIWMLTNSHPNATNSADVGAWLDGGGWNMSNWSNIDSHYEAMLLAPIPFPSNSIPGDYLAMEGQTIDQKLYPRLYNYYGKNLPDMRNRAITGSSGDGKNGTRAPLSYEANGVKSHSHTASSSTFDYATKTTSNAGGHTPSGKIDVVANGAHSHVITPMSLTGDGGNGSDSGDAYWRSASGSKKSTESAGSHGHTANFTGNPVGNHTHTVGIGSHSHTITVNAAGNTRNTIDNFAFRWIVRKR
ncbi:TPA: tail fiber protein [Enterobacter hormaechei subsp. xiangfangensis]|nr:tail fiber protein [Enterobacter hormaechei subsp. xiangfangensis]